MNSHVILAAVELITLHMVDGRVIQINPKQVTQLVSSPPAGAPNTVLIDSVHCVVRFVDGAHLSVAEDCETVRELMEGEER